MRPGERNLITDVAGLRVGNAAHAGLKSGVTVLTADQLLTASVSVLGGAPGTRETDLLAPDKMVPGVDALVLSGGSAFGLAAADGVAGALRRQGRGFVAAGQNVPIVPAAILFDLANGGGKDWDQNPYPELGAEALAAAAAEFDLGTAGAGTGAMAANCKGGLGSASLALDNGVIVGALVAANPVGSVTTPGDRHFWAAPFEIGDEFGGLGPDPRGDLGTTLDSRKARAMHGTGPGQNTTIAIVATDALLDKAGCQRMATAAHDGLARAIVPAHSPMDGDLVFGVATGARPLSGPLDALLIGHAAAVCLARAIARACYLATPAPDDKVPCWSDLNA